jgi:uncharacterized membrane-anchored protein
MEKINKVAQVSLLFWLMKCLATTLGDLGDYSPNTKPRLYDRANSDSGFFTCLSYSVYVKIHPRFYWLVIIATTTLGTEISDFIDGLAFRIYYGVLLLFSGLVLTLLLWLKNSKLKVYPITGQNKKFIIG